MLAKEIEKNQLKNDMKNRCLKNENKKRPKNTKHEVFPTEFVLKKWRVQKEG